MKSLLSSTEIDKSTPNFFSHWDLDTGVYDFTLQLYFKPKPPEANKPQPPSTANSTAAPGEPLGNPPRAPPPLMPVSLLPPPPMSNGHRSAPPVGSSTTASFNIGTRPPPMPPGQGFPGQQMQGQFTHPPPPPPPIMGK